MRYKSTLAVPHSSSPRGSTLFLPSTQSNALFINDHVKFIAALFSPATSIHLSVQHPYWYLCVTGCVCVCEFSAPDGLQAQVAPTVINSSWNYADALKFCKQPLILNLDIN